MKRMVSVLLALFLLVGSVACAESVTVENADASLVVNGVKVVLAQDDQIQKIKTIDGTLYVPLEAFLDAINLQYSINDGTIEVQTVNAKDNSVTNTVEDYYSQLPEKEAKFLDNFLLGIDSFKNPSSVQIKEVIDNKELPDMIYIVTVSAQNGFGGNTTTKYLSSFGLLLEAKNETKIKEDYTNEYKYDIPLLNKALKQKLAEKGY